MIKDILTIGGVVTALGAIIPIIWKLFKWIEHQQEQDKEIAKIKYQKKQMMAEQAVITYGVLACLKGLKEKGCNGPVSEAIEKIEKHLNQKAHELKED